MRILKVLGVCGLLAVSLAASGQRQMEQLDHGLVAVQTQDGVFVGWRVLASEADAVTYNIYRDGTKVNDVPITGASNLTDAAGLPGAVYELRTVVSGEEQVLNETTAVWEKRYIDIPVREINGGYASHEVNDASVGDLDGDGQYEVVVKRVAINKEITSTDYHLLEAYELDGTFLWSINIGPNLVNDKEVNFLVWDLDGDGKAEVATRTSEGTIDGLGNQVGDVNNDGKTNYRYSLQYNGFLSEGPHFLSIFNGETGEEMAREDYIARDPISQWGLPGHDIAQLAHRSTKCMFTVAYLDGKTPSVVISRGIYEKIALAAWKFENGELVKQWDFASDQPGNEDYDKQGFHSLTLGDVDNDGRDEIMYGSMCVDDDGTGLYSTNLGHGDAQHLADINPSRPGLEYFGCLENSTGGNYRDAGTGEILFYQSIGRDMGRAGCADVTPDYPGMEMWGPSGFPFLSATGKEITNMSPPGSMNFFIWWDGDPIRELLDHAWYSDYGIGTITKYNNGANTELLRASGTLSNNWTKGTPCVTADILGDWREEVIWRLEDNSGFRLYTTVEPTDLRIYTLMHDPQYRAAIGWQPNSYNQPPHPGFFIGHDMDSIPPAPVMLQGQKTWQGGTWNLDASAAFVYEGAAVKFMDGDSVLFDISGNQSATVPVEGILAPADIRVISPYDFMFEGTGIISGSTGLTKAGKGKLTIGNGNSFTGITRVWSGEVCVTGSLASKVLVKRFASVSGNGTFNNGLSLEKYSSMTVGTSRGTADTLFVNQSLSFAGEDSLYMDLSDDPDGAGQSNDMIRIDGDLIIQGPLVIDIQRLDGTLARGSYTLFEFTGAFTGDLASVSTSGISDIAHSLKIEDGTLILEIPETRGSTTVTWVGSEDNTWDMYHTLNWLNNGSPDVFIGNDTVLFNDQAEATDVRIMGNYGISHLRFNASKDITLGGEGFLTGNAGILKRGTGKLTINNLNTFTGATTVEEGILSIPEIRNGGAASGIGAASADASSLVLDGGTLEILALGNNATDKGITIGPGDGGISIPGTSGSVTFEGSFSGDGYLVKKGTGSIILKANAHKGTVIEKGTVILGNEDANYSGPGDEVIFRGGTLQMYNNYNSYTNNCNWNMVVEPGESGTLNMDGRSTITGRLTGAGELTVFVPWVRNEIHGDWSQFSGTINAITDNDGGMFIVGNTTGFKNASVHLGEKVRFIHSESADVVVEIGALTGEPGSILGAGGMASNNITWKIGGKNTSFTFNGIINNDQYKNSGARTSVIKTGSGQWTLTNENTYTGNTIVEQGTLLLENSPGSATGTGNVTVQPGAALAGTGSMSGNLTLEDDATLLPAYGQIGSIHIGGNLTMSGNPTLMIDLNKGASAHDQVIVDGNITLGGILMLSNLGMESYAEGDAFQVLLTTSEISGSFPVIYPLTPGDGLQWDTTLLRSQGYLRVVKATTAVETFSPQADLEVFPNPFKNSLNIQLPASAGIKEMQVFRIDGRRIEVDFESRDRAGWLLNTANLPAGTYLVKVSSAEGTIARKIVVKTK